MIELALTPNYEYDINLFQKEIKKYFGEKNVKLKKSSMSCDNGKIYLHLIFFPDEVILQTIEAIQKGAGHASKLMQKLTDTADKSKAKMSLTAYATPSKDDEKILSQKKLEAFYRKYGFKGSDNAFSRKPKLN